jgi:adenosine deaminase
MMMRDLRTLPKVELHVHLEGSMRPSTVVELADRYGIDLPDGLREGRYAFRDFRHFIDEWLAGIACLRAPEDFRRVALEFCQDEAAEGVRYVEVFVSLPDHALEDHDAVLEAVLDGFAQGRRFGVEARVLVDVVRGIMLERSRRAMEAAVRHAEHGVVGLTLGGDERFEPGPYAEIFAEARAAGLRSVPHAGETRGPASIRGAVEALGAERIGHGIRALEDPSVVELLVERGIALDVCPTSNAMTRSVPSLAEHPLPALLDAGLRCTLASDDPSMFGSRLVDEYEVCRRVFGLDDAALAGLARSGVRASFADEGTKRELERAIDDWLAGRSEASTVSG